MSKAPIKSIPVARSFKTVDSENYYGPMYDSTELCEWPKQEGGMNTYVSSPDSSYIRFGAAWSHALFTARVSLSGSSTSNRSHECI